MRSVYGRAGVGHHLVGAKDSGIREIELVGPRTAGQERLALRHQAADLSGLPESRGRGNAPDRRRRSAS